MPYPLYWCASVNDWFMASNETARFLKFVPDMRNIIDNTVESFLQPQLNIGWFGWV